MQHEVTELVLKNGTRGLLVNVPDAVVMTFEFNFRAGEYLVERDKWETPHLMEHLLLGANQKIPKARAFQAEFEKNGAYSNASTSAYDISYEAECADFEWDRVFKLLLAAITQPLFLGDEFWAEIGNVREELTARSNNHFRHLSLELRERYGFAVVTDKERLELMDNVSLEDVVTHYHQTHTTSNLRFVIAGKLTAPRQKTIEKLLDAVALPAGEGRLELPVERPQALKKPVHIRNNSIGNLYFYVDTFMGRQMSDPESDALGLVNTILCETYYSRILGTARERGLAYHVSSGFGQTKQSSNWWIGAQILPTNAASLFDIVRRELSEVFDGHVTTKDIQAAKQYSLGRYQRSGQTVAGTANGYAYRYFFDDQIDDYYAIPERIKSITREGMISIARALFSDKIWGLGTLGTSNQTLTAKLHKQLASLWR